MTREEAIKTLKENYCAMCAYGSQSMMSCDIRGCDNMDAIKALEQEQEQEPKTGRWIEEDMFDGDVAYRCSECNELFWLESGTPKDNEYNFCPKCGAKMGVEE